MEKKPTITFLKTQVLPSAILRSDRRGMRVVHILPLSLVLLSSLGILIEGDVYATIDVPNMTQTIPPSVSAPIQNISSRPPVSLEKLAINAQFVPSESNFTGSYQMSVFELNLSPSSQLCPKNDCQYGFEDGVLSPTASAYGLEGILHVATQATAGISSKLYDVRGDLYRVETLQQPDKVTNLLTGELTFVMTVEGIPSTNNGNGDDKITPSGGGDNKNNGNGDNDDDKQYGGKSNRRLAIQINSDNSQIITGQQNNAIFGQIFQGQKNIDQNKANDFDIKSIFNDCQVSTYSKLG